MTYGELRLRLVQMFPGIGLDLLEGWIADRYQELLTELPWHRRSARGVLRTAAPYETGTVELTQGATLITLTGGTWELGLYGRSFRIPGRNERYLFGRLTDLTADLDRPYEGPTSAASAYKIVQTVYNLPTDCRMVDENSFRPLERWSLGRLNMVDCDRGQSSAQPSVWLSYMDDQSFPPVMQVEIWPVPAAAIGLPFNYTAESPGLTYSTDLVEIWTSPTALIEGVAAKAKRHLKDYQGATLAAAEAQQALDRMRRTEAQGMAPTEMYLDPYFTSHRAKRWDW